MYDPQPPAWINDAYERYQLGLEETTSERLVTPEDVTLANNITDAIYEDTQRLREEDWVDRWHEHKASGEPDRINWQFVTVACVYAIFIFAVVWLGAAWLQYFLGFSF